MARKEEGCEGNEKNPERTNRDCFEFTLVETICPFRVFVHLLV